MRNPIPYVVLCVLLGCQDDPTEQELQINNDARENVVLERIASNETQSTYRMTNNGDKAFDYARWRDQGPEPVPYCKGNDGNVWICSATVFFLLRDKSELAEWIEMTELSSGASVEFHASDAKAKEVGVRFSLLSSDDLFVWSSSPR